MQDFGRRTRKMHTVQRVTLKQALGLQGGAVKRLSSRRLQYDVLFAFGA